MLFIGGNVIRRFGWLTGALVTPIMVLVTGAVFFALVIFRDHATGLVAALGTTPLMLAVVVGAIQNILSKSTNMLSLMQLKSWLTSHWIKSKS